MTTPLYSLELFVRESGGNSNKSTGCNIDVYCRASYIASNFLMLLKLVILVYWNKLVQLLYDLL